MENGTMALGSALLADTSMRKRVVALVAAVTLVFAMFVVIQSVDASSAGAGVVSTASVGGNDAAQVNIPGIIAQIVCPILIAVRNAFASTPFAGFVNPILNSLLAAFGCAPS